MTCQLDAVVRPMAVHSPPIRVAAVHALCFALQEPAARSSIGTGRGGHATRAFSFVAVLIPTACAATAAGTGRDRAATSTLVAVSTVKGGKRSHNLGKEKS